ncbi:MAG: Beta-galactosidase C-terminal domain, partial [Pseudomonadota bacterium]
FNIPDPLPPAWPGSDLTVSRVQSMRPDMPIALAPVGTIHSYFEQLEGGGATLMATTDGAPVAVACAARVTYMAAWGDAAAHMALIRALVPELPIAIMPEGVRRRETGAEVFWFNYGTEPVQVDGHTLDPAGVLRLAK